MNKRVIGTAHKYPFGGAALWIHGKYAPAFPLLVWKEGPVSALIAEEGEPVPEDRYYVRVLCLEGPVCVYDPDENTDPVFIGDDGDMVEVYRAGQRQVRFIIWPGWYANWEASESAGLIADDAPDFPDDYEATFYD